MQVLSRALCRFLYVPYEGISEREHRNRLQLQLQVWAPFDTPGFALIDAAAGCMVFAWDAVALAESAAHDPARRRPILPETLLRPRHTDGVVLQTCAEGFEGQVWRAGQLEASRWWVQAPDARAWMNFQRGAGVQVPAPLPALALQPAPPLPEPWAWPVTPQGLQEAQRLRWHAAMGGLALLLLLPTLWLGLNWWRSQAHLDALQMQSRQLDEELQPVLRVRSDALQGMAAVETLAKLVTRPAPLELLAHLSQRLPADGSVVRELDWEGQRLRLVLAVSARTPRIDYVQALEEGGWLRGVREEAQEAEPGQMALVAELSGPHPPTAPAPAATR